MISSVTQLALVTIALCYTAFSSTWPIIELDYNRTSQVQCVSWGGEREGCVLSDVAPCELYTYANCVSFYYYHSIMLEYL